MTTTTINTIATTILEQLGGAGRLVAMMGARNFLDLGDGLQFKLGRGAANKATHLTITLTADDLYTVRFQRVAKRGLEISEKGTTEGVYADQIRGLIERETGMYLSI